MCLDRCSFRLFLAAREGVIAISLLELPHWAADALGEWWREFDKFWSAMNGSNADMIYNHFLMN
jgi:hypothetical protein